MKWLQSLWRCCNRSWTVSGPDLRNACVKTEAILRALLSKHKFSNRQKTRWLFICFSFMTNKQIKNSCVDFFCFEIFPFHCPTLYITKVNSQPLTRRLEAVLQLFNLSPTDDVFVEGKGGQTAGRDSQVIVNAFWSLSKCNCYPSRISNSPFGSILWINLPLWRSLLASEGNKPLDA